MSDDTQKIVFIDVETTGVNVATNGLTQISGCVQIGDVVEDTFDYFVRPFPDDIVDPVALEVTGLDHRQLLPSDHPDFIEVDGQHFEDPRAVYAALQSTLKKHVDQYDKADKYQFVGYNSHSFDMPFIRRFWEKNNDRFFGSWFWYPSLDVMLVWAQILYAERASLTNFKLATVAQYCGIDVEDSRLHDSQYDIELTRKLWLKANGRLQPLLIDQSGWTQGELFS